MITTHFAMFSFFDGMSSGAEPPPPPADVPQQYGAPAWDYLKRLSAWRASRFLFDKREIEEELGERVDEANTAKERRQALAEQSEVEAFLRALEQASDQDAYVKRYERMAKKLDALCELVEAKEAQDEADDEEAVINMLRNLN